MKLDWQNEILPDEALSQFFVKKIVKYTEFDRYSLRSNASGKPAKWLTVGESLGLTFSEGRGARGEGHEWTPIGYSVRMISIIPVYDIMGNLAGTGFTPYNAHGAYGEANQTNSGSGN